MTLAEVKILIKTCAAQMDAHYGRTVFDEWAVISLAENRARVLAYVGPRNDDFLKNFANDLGSLRSELLTRTMARAISRSRGTAPARVLKGSWSWARRFT